MDEALPFSGELRESAATEGLVVCNRPPVDFDSVRAPPALSSTGETLQGRIEGVLGNAPW